jgi:hypothetical protein
MKIKAKVPLMLILIFLAVIILTAIINYHNFLKSKNVPICNLKSISTGSCYVYLKVKNKERNYIIVSPNNRLYYGLRSEKWLPFPYVYIYRLGHIIEKDHALKISDSLFNKMGYYIIDKNLINKYIEKELTNDTSIIKDGYINYRLGWENEKAIIYVLLKQGINCCYNCERGITNVMGKAPR